MSGGDSPPKRALAAGQNPLGPLSPLGPRSASSSRVSMLSIGRMPIISEDDNQLPKKKKPEDNPARPGNRRTVSLPILPPTHKRRPSQRGGRSGPPGAGPGPAPLGPPITRRSHYRPPSRTRGGQQPSFGLGTIYDGQFARTHSLYIPPHPPPDYYSHPNKGLGVHAHQPGYRDSLRRVLAGKQLPERAPPLKENYTQMEKIKESEWVARRGGWCRIILAAAIVIALIIGLSVGLTLGLKKNSPPSSPSTSADPVSSDATASFPAGDWELNTALTNVSTSCAAIAAAWRCPPYVTYASASPPSDASASFFWTIAPPDPQAGQHAYVVSSADNPFAPRFSNATMTLRDGNDPDERYEFEVAINRTVAAEAGPIPSGFAAGVSCVFSSVLRGVIWTDRVGGGTRNKTLESSGGQNTGTAWSGEIEITQSSTEGPRCTDADGAAVPAAAGNGECLCRYANYDLDSNSGAQRRRRRRGELLQ